MRVNDIVVRIPIPDDCGNELCVSLDRIIGVCSRGYRCMEPNAKMVKVSLIVEQYGYADVLFRIDPMSGVHRRIVETLSQKLLDPNCRQERGSKYLIDLGPLLKKAVGQWGEYDSKRVLKRKHVR